MRPMFQANEFNCANRIQWAMLDRPASQEGVVVAMVVTANPSVVFREESDNWAILFHPDTRASFGLNPIAAFIYRHLDGTNTSEQIVHNLIKQCSNVPCNAHEVVCTFLNELVDSGMAVLSSVTEET